MRRAIDIVKPSESEETPVATVTLAFSDRHKRRIRLTDDDGVPFLLDLAEATRLRSGDRLFLEEGGLIKVAAAKEDVAEIQTSSSKEAARIAWHIGNRHTELEIVSERHLRILWDHVLVQMLTDHLGAEVVKGSAPFEPEDGAYASGHNHNHTHTHARGHGADHGH